MIALSGCARKNADRELARVVAFIQGKADANRGCDQRAAYILDRVCADLAAKKHRDLAADVPVEPFTGVGGG